MTLVVEDNDGNRSSHSFYVMVLNQRPLAVMPRPVDGEVGQPYVFDASGSYDPDGLATDLTYRWEIDHEVIENISTVYYSFEEPGTYSVSLRVFDAEDQPSGLKTYTIEIQNPQPIPVIEARIATDGNDPIGGMADPKRPEYNLDGPPHNRWRDIPIAGSATLPGWDKEQGRGQQILKWQLNGP